MAVTAEPDGEAGSASAPPRARPNQVAAWLFLVSALIVVMIVAGGLTRLTDSGLSITEWKPVTGAIPPLSEADWNAEFAKYQTIPEFERQNFNMTLADFKTIYWWEWGHRLLGRLLGLVFLIPLVAFAWRRAIPPGFVPRLVVLFVLGGLQGAVGWWMVASGLSERVDVSQYRLAAHLSLAFLLLGAVWWTALDMRIGAPMRWRVSRSAGLAAGVFALICLQIVLGAFVAGLDGGRSYTDWPLVDGRLIPEAYTALGSTWANLFDNPVAAQINHRMVGYLVVVACLGLLIALRDETGPAVRRLTLWVAGLGAGQAALGIATLVNAAPVLLSAAHQLGAVALYLAALSLMRAAGEVTARS